jgi:hypothetical protein
VAPNAYVVCIMSHRGSMVVKVVQVGGWLWAGGWLVAWLAGGLVGGWLRAGGLCWGWWAGGWWAEARLVGC